jgi:sugar/nucleoside kinase (ribokinase family)
MVGALLITRGSRGATLVEQEHKKLRRHEIPGIPLEQPLDPTGCGDVFGAAYLWKFLESRNPRAAAEFANAAAAYNATRSGPEAIEDLRTGAERLRDRA